MGKFNPRDYIGRCFKWGNDSLYMKIYNVVGSGWIYAMTVERRGRLVSGRPYYEIKTRRSIYRSEIIGAIEITEPEFEAAVIDALNSVPSEHIYTTMNQ